MTTRLASLLGCALVLALAAGCVPSTPPANGGQGKLKQLTIGQGLDPETLDPHLSTVQASLNVSTLIAEPLVDRNYETNEIVPVLLTEWKEIDPVTWEFKVRPSVKFTNGEELTAQVVKANIERIKDPATKSPAAATYAGQIDKMDVVDPLTLRVTTKGPSPVMLLNLSKIYIISPRALAEMGAAEFAKKPVGTGPYSMVEWVKDDRVTLEANQAYWGGKPKLDKITFRPIPEPSARAAALRTGEADLVTLLPIPEVNNVKSSQDLEVSTTPSLRLMYLILDATKEGPVKDKQVRQALNYAVDKDAIIQQLLQGYGIQLQGQILSKEYTGFNPDLKSYPYDPEKAKQLLAAAGYPNGFEVTLYSPQGRYIMDKEISEAVAGQLAKVGVRANIKVEEWAAYIKDLIAKTLTPIAFIGMSTFPDADPMLGIQIAGNPYSYYANPEFDRIIKQARTTSNQQSRIALYKQATEILRDDPPGIFLHQQVDIYGVSKRVQGWKPRPDERLLIQQGTVGIDVR